MEVIWVISSTAMVIANIIQAKYLIKNVKWLIKDTYKLLKERVRK